MKPYAFGVDIGGTAIKLYYLAMKAEDPLGLLSREYYLVLENAPISNEAKSYGKPFQNTKGVLQNNAQKTARLGPKRVSYK